MSDGHYFDSEKAFREATEKTSGQPPEKPRPVFREAKVNLPKFATGDRLVMSTMCTPMIYATGDCIATASVGADYASSCSRHSEHGDPVSDYVFPIPGIFPSGDGGGFNGGGGCSGGGGASGSW